MKKSIIAWEKWYDPYATENINFPKSGEMPEDIDQDNDLQQFNPGMKVLATPLGLMPIDDNSMLSKKFNFWMGHTNFDITPNVLQLIEGVPGVETLEIFTRYRMRVGIGTMFKVGTVIGDVNETLKTYLNQDDSTKTTNNFTTQ